MLRPSYASNRSKRRRHVVPERGGGGRLGHQIDEGGEALLHAHPDGLPVRAVEQPGVFRIGPGDLDADFLDEAGQFGPHDRREFLRERPQRVFGIQRLYEMWHDKSPCSRRPVVG